MNQTSSQDEFAKWAKLKRDYERQMSALEASNRKLTDDRLKFNLRSKSLLWLGTNGIKLGLQFWYRKTPVFRLPHNSFPHFIEWWLAFPSSPLGTVYNGGMLINRFSERYGLGSRSR